MYFYKYLLFYWNTLKSLLFYFKTIATFATLINNKIKINKIMFNRFFDHSNNQDYIVIIKISLAINIGKTVVLKWKI